MFMNVKEIEASELVEWNNQQSGQFRIIDVRERGEIASGTINGAEAVPLATLPLKLSEFKQDEKLVMLCRSGARSAQACMFLQQQGFENVFNLRGGMFAWARLGQSIALPEAV